jgi:predicted negative regulator of RcsB-dependent stress response
MASAVSKHDLRQNVLVNAVVTVIRFLQARRGLALAVLGAIVVVGLAGAGYWWHQDRREGEASRLFAQAENAARPEGPDKPGKPEEAATLLLQVADRYRGTLSAEEALLRLGNLQYSAGKMDAASDAFGRYRREYPRGRFVVMGAIGQAYALEAKGDFQAAAQALTETLDRQKDQPIAGEAYTALARLYEELKKPEDATRVYRQIVDRYPQTQWAVNATQRLSAIKSKP